MKNKHFILLLALPIFLLNACISKEDKDPQPEPDTSETENTTASSEEQMASFNIPKVYITTPDGMTDIENMDRENYVKHSQIKIEGGKDFSDYQGEVKIRGRGHSSWETFPKKPFKLKLYENVSLLGMRTGKKYDLRSNWRSGWLMADPVASEIARLVGVSYILNCVPVALYLNGNYWGSYLLWEHKGSSPSRINVGEKGAFMEIDAYDDDDFQFDSKYYKLPVMPKVDDQAHSDFIEKEFNKMDSVIHDNSFPNNDYQDYLDVPSAASFFFVHLLTGNLELNKPKSVHMYTKGESGYFTFGPVWDFDWAYGYNGPYAAEGPTDTYFYYHDIPLLKANNKDANPGTVFFSRLLEAPAFKNQLKDIWENFETTGLSKLLRYIDDYSDNIREEQKKDYERWWENGNEEKWHNKSKYKIWKDRDGDFDKEITNLKNWLKTRATYVGSYINEL